MERWVMNKLGFINFWVYDVEEIPFKDGKLLLRGTNGSGKSITTQSFIPYILDGDRQPSRLDPFGSKDRKMEYYLLGDPENGKDESTGYLYLEFVKPESRQYRSIGIGLHAKKGSKMVTWGFCILDGKRIGYDIMLYREVGNERIPIDSKHLREQLGENNIYVEKTSEYKAMVAKHIFGIDIERISDFEQLTNILIKTRSSKLASKENLKPEQLYEILNESLQTLSDDDLHSMIESMNKIEDMHRKIEDAQNALKDVKAISYEYDRYNRYMLWKKACLYLRAHDDVVETQEEVNELNDKLCDEKRTVIEETEKLHNSTTCLDDLRLEKDSLRFDDIEKQLREKTESEKQLLEEKKKKDVKEMVLARKKDKCNKYYIDLKEKAIQKDDIVYDITQKLKQLEEYDEFVPPLHEQYIKGIRTDDNYYQYSGQCSREIGSYRDKLNSALHLLQQRDNLRDEYEKMSKSYDTEKDNLKKAEDSLKTARKLFDEQKDNIIEQYYSAAKNNLEYTIDDHMLAKIEHLICKYEGEGAAAELIKIISDHKVFILQKLNKEAAECNVMLKKAKKEYEDKSRELEELKNAAEPVPERTALRAEARRILSEKGICARPLYECIDFKDNVNDAQKALLEAELLDMGILDALIIPRSKHDDVINEIGELSECVIWLGEFSEPNQEDCENPYFIVTAHDELKFETQNILASAFSKNPLAAVIGTDGYYRNGILAGHSVCEFPARFIGAENRKRYREKQIDQLAAERDTLMSVYLDIAEKYDYANNRIVIMQNEYDNLPDTTDINQAFDMVQTEVGKVSLVKKRLNEIEENYKECKQKYDEKNSEAELFCRDIPYRRTQEDFKCAIVEIGNYLNDLQDALTTLRNKRDCIVEIDHLNDDIESIEADIDTADNELRGINAVIHKYEEIIKLCDEFLNRPENIDVAVRMQQIAADVNRHNEIIKESEKKIAGCERSISIYEKDIEKKNNKLTEYVARENELAVYFNEERELGLVILKNGLTTNQYAEEAVRSIDKNDSEKSIIQIQTRLTDVYRKYGSNLTAEYNLKLSECFEDTDSDSIRKRSRITLSYDGKQLAPALFEKELSGLIETYKLLVKHEEEQMFKEVLLDTISKKLYYKIDSSRRWVEEMSSLMKSINTSMGLSFSLTWKPKNNNGENEMSFNELYSVLNKNKDLISHEDYEKLSAHFRSRIEAEQRLLEEQGKDVNYSDLIRSVLDFRKWFEFRLQCRTADSDKFKELTMSRFNTFSGGERALSLYIPLFAAVAAQYKKAGEQAPIILALDEAFAGVDDSNISEMFGLLEKLGFGYIVNSQALWGCYDTVPGLEIAELCHEKDSDFITVILYEWNGVRKRLVE